MSKICAEKYRVAEIVNIEWLAATPERDARTLQINML